MGEKLNRFIAFYTEQATANVNEKKAKFDKYKEERQNAIDSLKFPVGGKYPTLGDLVKDMFPENGGVNNDLFNNVYSKLAALSKEDKEVITKLNKLSKSQIQYDNANSLLNKGGEKYFNELLDVLKEDEKVSLTDIIKGGIKGLNNFLADLDVVPESPPNIESSQELFDAISELASTAQTTELAKSPINVESAKTEGKEAGSSAINKTEGEAKAKTESPSSAITATETTEKKVESESKVISSPEAINTSKPEEKTASTEAKKEPLKTEVQSEQKAKPVVEPSSAISAKEKPANQEIVIGAKEINQLDATRKQEEIKQEKISSVLNKTSLTSEKKTEAQNILNRFAESRTSPAINKENKITSAEELSASFERSKGVAQELGKIGGSSPAVTAPSVSTTSTSQVANFENTESSAATGTTINQSTTSSSTTASPTTTINAPKNLTEAQQAVIDKYKEKMGILSPEQKAMSAELQKSIKIENIKAKEAGKTEPVVEKEKIAFNEKIPSSTRIDNTTSTQNTMQNLSQPIVKSEPPVPVKQEPVSSSEPEKEIAASPAQSTAMDVSGMEKRLKNIEMLLNGPLKVVIT